jgi:hypothetical protein
MVLITDANPQVRFAEKGGVPVRFVKVTIAAIQGKKLDSGQQLDSGPQLKEEHAPMKKNGATSGAPALEWRNSDHICALTDGERHVGHIVKIGGRWHAFDAMHSNPKGDGFRVLGTFASANAAREAVQHAYRFTPGASSAGAA